MNAPVKCNGCNKEFIPKHFNSKCCSDICRVTSRLISKKKYKSSAKGKISCSKWINSERRHKNEKRYRTTPTAKKLAVIRSRECLKRNVHLQERKRKRDKLYGKSEKGREINRKSVKLYLATENGKICQKNAKHKRRTIERNGKITAKEWAKKLEEHNFVCTFCKNNENIEMDHIVPLSKGGKHHIDNIQPLCRSCNASKGNKIIWAS